MLDETKEFVDDRIDQVRGRQDPRWQDEVAALRDAVAELTSVDGMAGASRDRPPKPRSR